MKEHELLETIAQNLDLLVRMKLSEVQKGRSQTDLIFLLDAFGCRPARIADLLKAKTTSINPILSRARAAAKKKTKKKKA